MPGRSDAPSGAIGLLAGAIGYALGACAQITPAEMALPTPCAEWDLRALLGHLARSMADLEAGIRTGYLDPTGPAPPAVAPAAAGDPVEPLRDQAANLLCACYDHHGPQRIVLVGDLPLAAGIVACTGAVEIAVHGWDASAARGRGQQIPPGLAARMLGLCPLLVASRPGLFALPVQVPAQASPGDRLVAYLGRSPAAPPQAPEHAAMA